ncbi:UNVERIFIED_CONTAM: hypothetical protein Slati_1716000 [Sesamum latifolium]|uniref:DUF4283 domain-containing protein n=1 Tax=Sesamum latifolium TaxID=2727402 RepID=A0AAW2WX50_9LAMI
MEQSTEGSRDALAPPAPGVPVEGTPCHEVPNCDLYVGNVKIDTSKSCRPAERIAEEFSNLTSRTLKFIPPEVQKGQVIVRPSMEAVEDGARRWRNTAVGYFLGQKPYFLHLQAFAHATRIGLQEKWVPGLPLSKHCPTHVSIWIRLKHLPMEFLTDEGLSTIASAVGKPLYSDRITRACSRLDFSCICVLLDYSSTLPKHLIVISPTKGGDKIPCHIDVEYEWVPNKCNVCKTLGRDTRTCPTKKGASKQGINVFVKRKRESTSKDHQEKDSRLVAVDNENRLPPFTIRVVDPLIQTYDCETRTAILTSPLKDKGKQIVTYNQFQVLQTEAEYGDDYQH